MEKDLREKILKALDEIRPFLETDGGGIELIESDGKVVKVRLLGNCVDCSVNQMTLKTGVEMTIKRYAPQIEKVIDINDLDG
ncbi:MAG: NifU family protein [Flavobacteriales bacterium AspAUS03]